MRTVTFASPQMLWLLLVLPVLWLLAWRHRTPFRPGRMAIATLLRSSVVALCALALANPVSSRRTDAVSVVYAIDVSRSVASDFLRTTLDWVREANRRARPEQARYVVFGDHARVVDSIDAIGAIPVAPTSSGPEDEVIGQSATNIERALDAALGGLSPNLAKRVVLVSDGNQTDGDAWRAARRLRAQGVRVFTVPAAVGAGREAWIEAIDVQEGAREQEPVTAVVKVFCGGRLDASVALTVDGVDPVRQSRALSAGENRLAFPIRFKHAGDVTLEARVERSASSGAPVDRAEQVVHVGARPKVLYVEGNAASAGYLRDALRGQGIDVTVQTPEAFSRDVGAPRNVDALVLSDIPAASVSPAAAQRTERFVREGGALLFAAGENVFGSEGFRKGTLEDVLPVKFEAPRKRKELDLVIMIDRSYSMHGKTLEYAKTAALSALDRLEEHHRLSVVAFDSLPHEVVPLRAVGNKRHAEDLISEISASGETNIFNALWHGYRLLKDSKANAKHIVLISDGDTAPPHEEESERARARAEIEKLYGVSGVKSKKLLHVEGGDPDRVQQPKDFEGMARMLAEKDITLSTVAIGEKPKVEFLAGLSKTTRGSHYVAIGDQEIPALLVKDTNRLLGESFIEEGFHPIVKTATAALDGVDVVHGPELKGFSIAHAKASSEVTLMAKDDHPLLVQNHHGLGRTVAFTSDLKNRWSVDWLAWPGYAKFWAQLVRDSIRRDGVETLEFRVRRERHDALVEVTARNVDTGYRNGLAPRVRVIAPDGTSSVVALNQTAPGTYTARTPLNAPGARAFRFELLETPGVESAEIARAGVRSVFFDRVDEDRGLPADRALLAAIADGTGGKDSPAIGDIFAPRGDGGVVTTALWPWFAAAALVAYLLDILVRRFGFGGARAR